MPNMDPKPIIDVEVEFGDGNSYWKNSEFPSAHSDSGVAVATPIPRIARSGTVTENARKLYATEELRSKNHTTAALFAFFLGAFGVHKFYLGYNTSGFLMLATSIIGGVLTFGLAAIVVEMIAIIEGVIYLTRNDAQFDHIYVVNQRDWF